SLGPEPRTARCHPADIAETSAIERLAADINGSGTGVDILIHSAGVHAIGRIEATTSEDLDRQYKTNVRGPFLLTRALLSALRTRRGQVVFINSSAGLAARGEVGPYAATKHALTALANSLREEVNSDGIR